MQMPILVGIGLYNKLSQITHMVFFWACKFSIMMKMMIKMKSLTTVKDVHWEN